MAIRDEKVRWFDIPVDNSLRMCGVERIGNLDAQIEHRLDVHRPAGDHMPKRLSLQQLHGNEGSPVSLIDFVNCADVWVIQRRCSLGFALKTAEGLRITAQFVGKKLERDIATQLEIFRLVHNTHSASTQPLHNAVVRNGLADHWAEILGPGMGQVNEVGRSWLPREDN